VENNESPRSQTPIAFAVHCAPVGNADKFGIPETLGCLLTVRYQRWRDLVESLDELCCTQDFVEATSKIPKKAPWSAFGGIGGGQVEYIACDLSEVRWALKRCGELPSRRNNGSTVLSDLPLSPVPLVTEVVKVGDAQRWKRLVSPEHSIYSRGAYIGFGVPSGTRWNAEILYLTTFSSRFSSPIISSITSASYWEGS
jgi:hypothetical protein